ncbi:MAG: hypothetical protein DPW18_01290 [Chloroflexi bacterium]|nr:hypothetical protein [Chloroflexota bacterium]MDL1940859.1 ABC transporter permease subunit [Chloroflexi bacterium CFX2]
MLDFDFMLKNWTFIAGGVGATLGVAVVALLLAIPLALILGLGRRSTNSPIRVTSTFFVSALDATPLYVQILFIFLALPQLGIFLPGLLAGSLALAVNYGARLSEVFRAGFATAGHGQRVSWRGLGLVGFDEVIALMRDTALIAATGFVHEIVWRAIRVGRAEFKNLEAFLIAIALYWLLLLVPAFIIRTLKNGMTTAELNLETDQ